MNEGRKVILYPHAPRSSTKALCISNRIPQFLCSCVKPAADFTGVKKEEISAEKFRKVMPEKVLNSYISPPNPCSCLTDEETDPTEVTQVVAGNWELTSGSLGSWAGVLSTVPCWGNLGTCFATPIPCVLNRCVFGVFYDKCPRFPLLQLHRNVFRDCDLDAVVRLGSRAGKAFRFY